MIDLAPSPYKLARDLAQLRARAQQASHRFSNTPDSALTEAARAASDSLLQDLVAAHLKCEAIGAHVGAEASAWEQLSELMPAAYLLTDGASVILNANKAAGQLLNVPARRLRDRQFTWFADDRAAFVHLSNRLVAEGGVVRATLRIRPRGRRPRAVGLIVAPGRQSVIATWLWFLVPAGEMDLSEARGA